MLEKLPIISNPALLSGNGMKNPKKYLCSNLLQLPSAG
jgi:hypothetical protein